MNGHEFGELINRARSDLARLQRQADRLAREPHDPLTMSLTELANTLQALAGAQPALDMDATSRRKIEEELRRQRDFAESLIETAQAIILVLDPQGCIVRFNSYMEQLSGYQLAEVVGANWVTTFVAPRERARIRDLIQYAIDGVSTRGNVNAIVTKEGHEIEIEWHDTVLSDEQGKTLGLLSIGQDVTQRRQTERALRQSDAQNRALLTAIPDSIVRMRRDGTYLYVKDLFNFTPIIPVEQMVGRNVRDIVEPELARRILENSERALQTHELQTFEYEIQIGPEMRAREARIVPAGDDESIMILRDVTERKRAQAEEARLLNEVQEQRVQLRALNRRLAAVQEAERRGLASELHDQVGQNLSTLGIHLNIMQTQLKDILPATAPTQLLLTDSQKLLKQTMGQVRNVLTELRPPMLDDYGLPATLSWYAERMVQLAAFAVKVDVEEIEPRLSEFKESTLFRIAQEAMTNILKHAQATEVHVRLHADHENVYLSIVDNGCGFDLTRQRGQRQSWGLLTMRERAEAVGGSFKITSGVGEGTQVRIVMQREAGRQ
ncbi:MAG: PAS domain S-box protein [Caldilineaceae bacterium]